MINNKLIFTVSENGSIGEWTLPGTALKSNEGGDFWRMIADDGYYMEKLFEAFFMGK